MLGQGEAPGPPKALLMEPSPLGQKEVEPPLALRELGEGSAQVCMDSGLHSWKRRAVNRD